jgi:hypothetical protein
VWKPTSRSGFPSRTAFANQRGSTVFAAYQSERRDVK